MLHGCGDGHDGEGGGDFNQCSSTLTQTKLANLMIMMMVKLDQTDFAVDCS